MKPRCYGTEEHSKSVICKKCKYEEGCIMVLNKSKKCDHCGKVNDCTQTNCTECNLALDLGDY